AELLDGFRIHALAEFGPMALMVLDYWGVVSTADVGQMVFNLVQAGIFGKTDEDTTESFRDVFDFREAFVAPFRPLSGSLNEDASLQVEIHP
ncbi:MAG: Minf_1886 family protein, partial [Terrimicrobiaceae bacterium]